MDDPDLVEQAARVIQAAEAKHDFDIDQAHYECGNHRRPPVLATWESLRGDHEVYRAQARALAAAGMLQASSGTLSTNINNVRYIAGIVDNGVLFASEALLHETREAAQAELDEFEDGDDWAVLEVRVVDERAAGMLQHTTTPQESEPLVPWCEIHHHDARTCACPEWAYEQRHADCATAGGVCIAHTSALRSCRAWPVIIR